MTAIGALDRQITIRRYTVVGDDGYGNIIHDWADLVTVAASRMDVSDTERVAYGGIVSELISRFVIRHAGPAATVNAADRLAHKGEPWEIMGVKQTLAGRNRFLEITAKREG
jgi:SPP1 family predicted phage head-tail adaptor